MLEINNHKLDVYIINDQPTVCAVCGARTDFEDVADKVQLHQCLNLNCGYKFLIEED